MLRRARFLLVLCVVVAMTGTWKAAAEDEPGWAPLFDGRTLDGWVRRGGEATYRVEGGAIVGRAVANTPNTFLCTAQDYTDFTLELEFKVDPRLNSGVQIRSNSVAGYKQGAVHGYQVEIDPSERAYTAGIYDEGRRGWLCDLKDNAAAQKAFKQNEWNQVRVEARGDSLKTWLNGAPVADLKDALTRSGFIGLQVHATDAAEPLEVRWQNLRIKDFGDPWARPPARAVVLLGPGGDLSTWEHVDKPGTPVQWTWADGALEAKPGAGSIVTKRAFGDCRLHVEFCVDDNGKTGQDNGNSGVYLQRRYEVQILNSSGQAPADNICGAIYGVKAPDFNMARPAGQWQTYDIEFYAPRWDKDAKKTENARMTVYHNGTRVQDNVEVLQATGAGQPEGPRDAALALQDHGNKVRFRNIWIEPLK